MKTVLFVALLALLVVAFFGRRARLDPERIYVSEVTYQARDRATGATIPTEIDFVTEKNVGLFRHSASSVPPSALRILYAADREVKLRVTSDGYESVVVTLSKVSKEEIIDLAKR